MGGDTRARAGSMTGLLRPALAGDIARIVEIERACFADPWSEAAFRRILEEHSAIFLVAIPSSESALAGYAIAFSVGADAEILNVAVEAPFRGRGLAGQMLDAISIQLSARGVRNAFLEVRESNAAARALYESRGFVEIGRRGGYYRRPVEDALVLRRVMDTTEGESSAGSFADR
jgi:ribosomal-protein-alanine N-acetyltransferase